MTGAFLDPAAPGAGIRGRLMARAVRAYRRLQRYGRRLVKRARKARHSLAAGRRSMERSLRPLLRLRTKIARAQSRALRSPGLLGQPRSGFGVTVLRRDAYVRLKADLRIARSRETHAVDLRSATSDPVAALYLCRGTPFVIDVPIARCRGVGMSPSGLGAADNPFVATLTRWLETGQEDFAATPLADYYGRVQPASAAAVVGLGAGSVLARYPPHAAVLPWQTRDPDQRLRFMERHGARWYAPRRRSASDVERGLTEYGPVTATKGAEEIARLLRVYRSISQHGFTRDRGDVTGTLLLGDGDWACHVVDGLHRIAALLVLGKTHVPVRIVVHDVTFAVRRSEVDAWPQVRSGLLSREEALLVFDRLLQGA